MTGHGGDIYRASQELGIAEEKIIDFSASINPLGIPETVIADIKKNAVNCRHYPDSEARQLVSHLAKIHRINPESIICGNGSTELIYLVVRALKPDKVLIPAPTFSEYERACRMNEELRVMSYELRKENNFDLNPDEFTSAMGGDGNLDAGTHNSEITPSRITHNSSRTFDMAFICNPNNPTGRLIKKSDMLKIVDSAKSHKCYLVIDEAFIDFSPQDSMLRDVRNNPYLIVLRSMTKFYALAGLRIGYGVFPLHIVETLRKHKEPWTVNTLVQRAGMIAADDVAYKQETLSLIKKEKTFLKDGFKKLNIDYIPSSANYYLIRMDNAQAVISSLRKKGILVRSCHNFTGLDASYIRIAVKNRKDNALLLKELANLCRAWS
ncbi:MAG: threonine-phosphate decarboxylase [Thermodesulfovibrio sp.]|nr:threonine-phosphate decarboxylase [Thermodesulfovibrio sp.]